MKEIKQQEDKNRTIKIIIGCFAAFFGAMALLIVFLIINYIRNKTNPPQFPTSQNQEDNTIGETSKEWPEAFNFYEQDLRYPNATITDSRYYPEYEYATTGIDLETEDSVENAFDYYISLIEKNNWDLTYVLYPNSGEGVTRADLQIDDPTTRYYFIISIMKYKEKRYTDMYGFNTHINIQITVQGGWD